MELTDVEKMALGQCTQQERECIYQAVRATMMSDGDSAQPEQGLLDQMAVMLGLSEQEREESKGIARSVLVGTIHGMNYFKRLATGKLMTQMVYADGIVTQREQLFIQHVFDQFNIPAAD